MQTPATHFLWGDTYSQVDLTLTQYHMGTNFHDDHMIPQSLQSHSNGKHKGNIHNFYQLSGDHGCTKSPGKRAPDWHMRYKVM